jgi:two-component system, chemotaxis family, protein-glutamate methylesterase/glutaminase
MLKKQIKVLIVDDSALIRDLLTQILSSDHAIDVLGAAVDPFDAREKIKQLKPDVITLDIEMPRMDGITFLENLMRLYPMPVVMISTLTQKGADATMRALELGAVDFIAKPKTNVNVCMGKIAQEIIDKVKYAAKSNIHVIEQIFNHQQPPAPKKLPSDAKRNNKVKVIAIGASTGGTEATKEVLASLPDKMPPILITQHMPAGFTTSYAQRLDSQCKLKVVEFDGKPQPLLDNHVYLANGAFHMLMIEREDVFKLIQHDGDPVNRHKPSVDVLFDSVAGACGNKSVGIILTGMGVDGASGLGKMRNNGAYTIAQDKNSSVVWGMPRAATDQNAAREVLPLQKIAGRLVKLCYH